MVESIQRLVFRNGEMNQSALRKQLPAVSLYVVHVLFESKVGTLADQLNIICFSDMSIISDSYFNT